MKTLVIHPFDITTGFLEDIYIDKDWTVVDWNPSKCGLKNLIKEHDRIIMLGHGTEDGLLGYNRFVINSELVYLLREKLCVCIWCNADKFVEKYSLKGFYTGMIISEHEEAIMFCVNTTNTEIYNSNTLFAKAITAKEFSLAVAQIVVPSRGSSAISTSTPPRPTFSPI